MSRLFLTALILTVLFSGAVAQEDSSQSQESCSAESISDEIGGYIAEYSDAIVESTDPLEVLAAAQTLEVQIASVQEKCAAAEEAAPEETTTESSTEMVDAADFDPATLKTGLWRVTWSSALRSCPDNPNITVSSADRVFLLDVLDNKIVLDDIFTWRPNLTLSRVANGTFLYNRNETFSNGVAFTFEYRVLRASPTLIDGVVTNFYIAYNCSLQNAFQLTFVDDSIQCIVGPASGANVRSEPNASGNRLRSMEVQERAPVISQRRGADSFIWYELQTGGWVRSDVVLSAGDCAGVPVSTP
jgi:hypothetical protein